jgi:hypothetical protein
LFVTNTFIEHLEVVSAEDIVLLFVLLVVMLPLAVGVVAAV